MTAATGSWVATSSALTLRRRGRGRGKRGDGSHRGSDQNQDKDQDQDKDKDKDKDQDQDKNQDKDQDKDKDQDQDLGVVDPLLRVRGVRGLRVADASILPLVPNGNPLATVMAVAAVAADLLQQRGTDDVE